MLNLASLGLMAFWDPTSANRWFLLGLLGLWGVADGIWQSQINSKYDTLSDFVTIPPSLSDFATITPSLFVTYCVCIKVDTKVFFFLN